MKMYSTFLFCFCFVLFLLTQVYLVFRSGGKSLEDNLHNKSSAAKFISRSQPRTYASASSVNVSTGHLNHPNGKLYFILQFDFSIT